MGNIVYAKVDGDLHEIKVLIRKKIVSAVTYRNDWGDTTAIVARHGVNKTKLQQIAKEEKKKQ